MSYNDIQGVSEKMERAHVTKVWQEMFGPQSQNEDNSINIEDQQAIHSSF